MFLKPLGPEGVVYLLWSKKLAFYKIGFTRKEARDRVRELNEELNAEWEIIALLETREPKILERLFHKSLEESRVAPNREWFRLTRNQADLFIRLAEDQKWVRESAYKAGGDQRKGPEDSRGDESSDVVIDQWETRAKARELFGPPTDVALREDRSKNVKPWSSVIRTLKKRGQAQAATVYAGCIVELRGDLLTLSYPIEKSDYYANEGRKLPHLRALKDVVEDVTGIRPRIELQGEEFF